MGALSRALALAAVLSLAGCGVLRWAFVPSSPGEPSRVEQGAQLIAQNGTDPGKWIGWLAGGGVIAGAGAGFAGGRWKDRRSGRDRRVAGDV